MVQPNICETCDNFVAASEHADTIRCQLADIPHLYADVTARGCDSEAARHDRVSQALQRLQH